MRHSDVAIYVYCLMCVLGIGALLWEQLVPGVEPDMDERNLETAEMIEEAYALHLLAMRSTLASQACHGVKPRAFRSSMCR